MDTRSISPARRRAAGRWIKRVLFAAFIVVGLGTVVMSMLPKPVAVDLAIVEVGPLRVTVDEDGRTRVKDRYIVSAPIGGRVVRIELDPGAEVRRGNALAHLVPRASELLDTRSKKAAQARVSAATAARKQAKAQISRASAALEFARAEATRYKRLAKDEIASAQQLDEARMRERTATAELESARFALRVADHELEMARAALGHLSHPSNGSQAQLVVTAPVDGRVLEVYQESEGVVQAGAPLLSIGDPTALEVVVDVLTQDAVRLRPGANVVVDRWGGPPLKGQVRRVEPSAFTRLSALGVEEQRVNVIVDLVGEPKQWSALGDGYRVETHMTIWEREDALTIPASAVFRYEGKWVVYRPVDGKAQRVPVQIGHRTDRRVEVITGLTKGTAVVVHPSDKVQPGTRIAARD